MRNLLIDELMRPNLIIYLDAPTDVVQSKIRGRAQATHPWEKVGCCTLQGLYLTPTMCPAPSPYTCRTALCGRTRST